MSPRSPLCRGNLSQGKGWGLGEQKPAKSHRENPFSPKTCSNPSLPRRLPGATRGSSSSLQRLNDQADTKINAAQSRYGGLSCIWHITWLLVGCRLLFGDMRQLLLGLWGFALSCLLLGHVSRVRLWLHHPGVERFLQCPRGCHDVRGHLLNLHTNCDLGTRNICHRGGRTRERRGGSEYPQMPGERGGKTPDLPLTGSDPKLVLPSLVCPTGAQSRC